MNLYQVLIWLTVIICGLFPALAPSSECLAQPVTQTSETSDDPPGRFVHYISAEGGYFTARREMFRELYGSYLNYALGFERQHQGAWGWGIRVEFIRLKKRKLANLRYWTIALSPIVTYRLTHLVGFQPVVGAGIGVSYRNITYFGYRVDPWGQPVGGLAATQTELSVFTILTSGADINLSQKVVLGARTYFDYYPLGDPSTGDFGDTGGFHFVARLAFRI